MRPSRREFLSMTAAAGLAAAVPTVLQAQTPARDVPAGDRIRLATIGVGIQGQGDTRTALRVPGVELVAVADVYDGRLTRAKEIWGNQIFTTRDYREVLARPDVDAVIIATPDHWHATDRHRRDEGGQGRLRREADGAGARGRAAGHRGGAEDQPDPAGRQPARQLDRLRQGARSVQGRRDRRAEPGRSVDESQLGDRRVAVLDSARRVARRRSIGTASSATRRSGRSSPMRLFRWRNYRDYGTGIAGDLFVHLFTGMHFVLDSLGPTRVMATGGLRYWKDGRDVPDVMLALYDYPKTAAHPAFTLALKVNFAERRRRRVRRSASSAPKACSRSAAARSRCRGGRGRKSRARRSTPSRRPCRRRS